MRCSVVAAVLLGVLVGDALSAALPVKEKHHQEEEAQANKEGEGEHGDDWELNLEYGRYLKEVVQALESDPSFRKKLENAEVDDIKSGKIARELHFVDHNIRTKLDELKRRELERLRHLAVKEHEKKTGVDRTLLKMPVHIDHRNPTRFEVEDLKKLIVKTTEDLEKVDKQRRTEFKEYEIEKEYQRKHELEEMDEEHRNQAEAQHQQQVKKHAEHPKLHHPGSKQQLEEVWEEQDHMQPEDFDPNTFFHLHDLDNNGYWDETEVKMLFKKELDKMYDANAPEDDIRERFEEMERMREHVFKESDTDHDNLISYQEFVEQTKRVEFEQDGGWAGLHEQELYSQQEYERYEHERQEEIRRLVESGAIPPPPGYHGSPPGQAAVYNGGPHPGLATPQHHLPQLQHNDIDQGHHAQGYQAVHQGNQAIPQGYQAVPQGYQAIPQGYQAVPQGYQAVPQGYQAPPQGYQAAPQMQQAVPQGYQQVQYQPQAQFPHQEVVAQSHPNQGQAVLGQQHPQAAQGHPQAAQDQAHPQVQVPQASHAQGQVPQVQAQVPLGQAQVPQAQAQIPQGQVQVPQVPQVPQVQAQVPQAQAQNIPGQGQVMQGQHPNLQMPISGHVQQPPQPLAG